MLFHAFPLGSFVSLTNMLPHLLCPLLSAATYITYHCYRFQGALLDRSSYHIGHSLLSPLPSPLVSDFLYCICLYSQFSINVHRIPASGLPFMSIPLSLFLTSHYIATPISLRVFAAKHPGQQTLTCYIFTSLSLLLHNSD